MLKKKKEYEPRIDAPRFDPWACTTYMTQSAVPKLCVEVPGVSNSIHRGTAGYFKISKESTVTFDICWTLH